MPPYTKASDNAHIFSQNFNFILFNDVSGRVDKLIHRVPSVDGRPSWLPTTNKPPETSTKTHKMWFEIENEKLLRISDSQRGENIMLKLFYFARSLNKSIMTLLPSHLPRF